jgi:hypothetical protein
MTSIFLFIVYSNSCIGNSLYEIYCNSNTYYSNKFNYYLIVLNSLKDYSIDVLICVLMFEFSYSYVSAKCCSNLINLTKLSNFSSCS